MYSYFTDLDFQWAMQGGLKMLSIRLDSIESTRIVSPVVDSSCQKSICKTRALYESRRDVTCKSSRIIKCFRQVDSVSVYWTWMLLPRSSFLHRSTLVAWLVQREDCRGGFQKKIFNEAEEIASLDMGARNQYSSINLFGEFIENIS